MSDNPLLSPALDPNGLKQPQGKPAPFRVQRTQNTDDNALSQALGLGPMKEQLAEDRLKLDLQEGELSVPRLTKPPPTQVPTDPLQAFGQTGMWIAIFGSLLTRAHLTTAIQAAAGVMKSTHDQDLALAKQRYDTWKIESENAIKMAKFEQEAYKNAINRYRSDAAAGEAEIKTLAAAFKNAALKQVYETEGMQGVIKYLGKRGQDTSMLSLRAIELQDKMLDHMDKLRMRQDFDAAHPNATPTEKDAAYLAIDKGQDPEAGKGAGANWQVGTDTSNGKQFVYRIKPDGSLEAKDTQGQPYTPGGVAGKPSGSMGEAISDETADTIAGMIEGGNPSAAVGMSRNPANMKKIDDALVARMKTRGETPADINAHIANYHGLLAQERTLGSIEPRVTLGINELDTLIPQAREASERVFRLGNIPIDKIVQALQGTSDDPRLADFQAVNQSVANAFAQVATRGGQPTEGAREHAYALLSTVRDDKSYQTILDRLEKEGQAFQGAVAKTRGAIESQASHRPPPPPGAIQMLRSNPSLAPQFDQKYGPGSAERVLNGG